MAHCAILEPDLFKRTYVPIPDEIRAGTNAEKDFLRAHGEGYESLEPVKTRLYWLAIAIAEQVAGHVLAGPLLSAAKNEVSILWEHSSGLLCKSRLDAIREDHGVLVDIKTTKDPRANSFSRDIADYGYHRQMAFYKMAAESCGVTVNGVWLIAITNEEPASVHLYEISEETLDVGKQEVNSLIEKYKQCVDTDSWAPDTKELQSIGLPSWYVRK